MEPQDIIDILTMQRNQALDGVVVATAETASLKRRIAELEAQVAEEDPPSPDGD